MAQTAYNLGPLNAQGYDSHFTTHSKHIANIADHETRIASGETKLATVATGSTANLPDASLLSRANHTGTQAASTISGTFTTGQIGSGTAAAGKYVDGGTGAWTTLPVGGGSYTLPPATATVLGGVKDGTGLTIAGDGTASVDYGTTAGTAAQGNDTRFSDYEARISALKAVGLAASLYGVKADGTTNDDAAWAAVFSAAQTLGARNVLAPYGTSIVTSITIPPSVTLIGVPTYSYYSTPNTGSILKCASTVQTTPIVALSQFSGIRSMTIVGSGGANMGSVPPTGTITSQLAGIKATSFPANILDCSILGCRTGIDMSGYGGLIQRCSITANHDGIKLPVDAMISACFIAFNLNRGIEGTNSSDVLLTNSKVEWNNDHGIYLSGARHWMISNNIIDRQGKTGLYVTGSSWKISVQNNLFWRNGRMSSGSTINDCHWYLDSISDSVFSGNITDSGVGDSGEVGGYDSPAYCMGGDNASNVIIANNNLSGFKVAFLGNVGFGNWTLGHNAGMPFAFSPVTSQNILAKKELYAVNASSDFITWTGPAVPQFGIAVAYDFTIVSRNQGTGAASSCSGQVVVTNESGTAATTRVVTNVIGATFGLTAANFNITTSVSANGSSVTLTVGNTVGAACNFVVTIQRRAS